MEKVKSRRFIAFCIALVFIVAISIISLAEPPTVVGIGGRITINDTPIENGTAVTVKNNNTGVYDNATTENGWYASSMSARDGNIISVKVLYEGVYYWNHVTIGTSHTTQWCNISITVPNNNIVADTGGIYSGMEGVTILLDGSGSSGNIISYEWVCNGVEKSGINPSYILNNGVHTVLLTVTDGENTDTDEATITVSNIPPIAGIGKEYYFGDAGYSITFDASSSTDAYDDLLYRWDFDGKGWDTEWLDVPTANHSYYSSGIYPVTLEVTDGDDTDVDDACAIISGSNNIPPTADFHYDLSNYTVVITDNSADEDGVIVNRTWNFGDGNISFVKNPIHEYRCSGSYNVSLTVTDDEGATDEKIKEITVENDDIVVNLIPVANFTYEVNNNTVYLNSTSFDYDGSIVNWTWGFGDDVIGYNEKTSHIYNEGIYAVNLSVTDDGNASDSIIKEISIHIGNNDNDTAFYNLTLFVAGKDEKPVEGAEISISGTKIYTNSAGKARKSLENGTYTVSILKEGYNVEQGSITLSSDKTMNISLSEKRDTPLSAVIPIFAIVMLAIWGWKHER